MTLTLLSIYASNQRRSITLTTSSSKPPLNRTCRAPKALLIDTAAVGRPSTSSPPIASDAGQGRKAAAVMEIVSLSSAERLKHVRDFDALARLLGPADRAGASLTKKERSNLALVAEQPDVSRLAALSINLMTRSAAL